LRFQAPAPVAPWSGVRDALVYGPTAPQPYRPSTLIPEPTIGGDDYLNLNVFTPDLSPGRRPVLVWIHGGGFFAGGNVSPWFRGASFTRAGIVFVAINYRLGVEGFLPIEGAPSNRAVRDWIAALEWVRDDIEAFGGDPDNVTIAGHSAGGMACATLLATPEARGLFNKAILMSGSIELRGANKAMGAFLPRFETLLGARATSAALAEVSTEQLIAAQAGASGPGEKGSAEDVAAGFARGMALRPQIDGDLLRGDIGQAIRAGASADVPVMVGSTADEFLFLIHQADPEKLDRTLAAFFADAAGDARFRRNHPGATPDELIGCAIGEYTFRAPAAKLAEFRLDASAPTYLYDFRWRPREGLLRSCHCLDVPFVFDCLDQKKVADIAGAESPQSLADAVHGAWASFIKTGQAGWPAYRAAKREAMVFDDPCRIEGDALRGEREAWLNVAPEPATTS
jgi:para-nitrobenzyl esterase